jgi:sec-independent protein translocase protein TatC
MREDEKAPFTDHLEELRKRLIICIIAVAVGFILTYAFKEFIFHLLMDPLERELKEMGFKLAFKTLHEPFFTYLKVAALTGVLLATPVVFYEFWMFIAPGLYLKERRLLLPVVSLSSIFFISGILFGYYVVYPLATQFFLNFSNETLEPVLQMGEAFSFTTKLLLAFGLVFELPLVLIFLAKLGIVTVPFLKKNRKYALILFFIGSAILTPPDVISQVMMALPLMVLYEISIIGAIIVGKKKRVDVDEDEEDSAEAQQ